MSGSSKGQAAMEYLVTYGWALLLLVAIIAALLASGVFSASAFVQRECTFQPDFQCWPFVLYKGGTAATASTYLSTQFHNGFGYPIKITEINYTVENIGAEGVRTVQSGDVPTGVIEQGGNITITQEFAGTTRQPSVGEMKTIKVTVTYVNCALAGTPATCTGGNPPSHVVSGRVVARVEQGTAPGGRPRD
jgi:hypothetical protein